MDICVDVGNTTIVIASLIDGAINNKIVLLEEKKPSFSYVFKLLRKTFGKEKVDSIFYSSVVPDIDKMLIFILKRAFKHNIFIRINNSAKTDIVCNVDNPSEIGTDLLADLVSGINKYGYPLLIADLGTASKLLLINDKGEFCGCSFMPGLSLSAKALCNNAALLPNINLEGDKKTIGTNTIDAMTSGIIVGHASMIERLAERYENEIGYKCKKILTGGSSIYLKDLIGSSFIYDEDLVIYGIYHLGQIEKGK